MNLLTYYVRVLLCGLCKSWREHTTHELSTPVDIELYGVLGLLSETAPDYLLVPTVE